MTEQEIRTTVNQLFEASWKVMLQTINLMGDIRNLRDELNKGQEQKIIELPFPDWATINKNKPSKTNLRKTDKGSGGQVK